MKPDPILARLRAPAMNRRGLWPNLTLADHLARALQAGPERTAIVDHGAVGHAVRRLSYRELERASAALAASLRRLGLGAGDVVSIQLPNCWQFLAAVLACSRIGAIANPLMPIFREHELEFMLAHAETRLLIGPRTFRGRDHAAMLRALRPRLPRLQHLRILGEDGAEGLAPMLQTAADEAPLPANAQHPDDVALLMFTSGTTGEPKGVMHTSNTLTATLRSATDELGIARDDVALCAAPMGHMVGLALLGILPLMAQACTVIIDAWDAPRAMDLAAREGVTFTAGATPYLADILQACAQAGGAPGRLRLLCCAGSPIPPVLIERAARELGLTVCSLWGMTEVQAGTITSAAAGSRMSARADGRPPAGMALRIVDEQRREMPLGQTGRLLVRGSGVFAGYLKRPEWNAVDADGWFDTGDLAYRVDDEGYIRIDGRARDIIKRGGESIPVVEVESLLLRHPGIATVAIVGYPDARLGERACAFVVPQPGHAPDLPALKQHLADCRLTPQYWPERVELVDELPRTASGKIQKFVLRERAAAFAKP
ncbi:MAG: AMP-binding protein [Rubrivivax sp.]